MSEVKVEPGTTLAEYTTLRVGGPASEIVEATSATEIVDRVEAADSAGQSLLILGGGSNVVISDDGWPGPVLLVRNCGITISDSCGSSEVTAAAGEPWDDFVTEMVASGFSGVEALAGIPGSVGAAPIQNVGAYGQEVAQVITRIRAWDRHRSKIVKLMNEDCNFSYRNSRFKRDPDRFVVLAVTFGLEKSPLSAPIHYSELALTLGVGVSDRASAVATRDAVLNLRRSKGMVLDSADPDSNSAGSFFTNPILSPDQATKLPEDAPRFEVAEGVKTSAAWLIEQSGFSRGYGSGAARISSKHTLALTNPHAASSHDILNLAREIRAGVQTKFGVVLEPEPVLVRCHL